LGILTIFEVLVSFNIIPIFDILCSTKLLCHEKDAKTNCLFTNVQCFV